MTLVQTRAAPLPVRQNVPGRIRVISGVTVASLALLFVALAVGGSSARDGLEVIGRDAGPQVVATAGLYLALSDMDAQVANALVMGDQYTEQRQEAVARYERRRSEANQALLKAFELAGDNAAERRTMQSVLDGLGRYERLAGQALLLGERAGHAPGPPPAEVVRTYRAATDLMRLVLLPQAYNLTLETGTIVRRTYDEKALLVPLSQGAVAVAGLLALACLIWLQVFLARRFRRLFGPALLAATLVTAVTLVFGVNVLGQDQQALRTAKSAGFDSLLTLAKARAISNSMQGDQSRYLLDKERADTYEHTFLDKSLSVLYIEAGNLDAYHDAVNRNSNDFLGLLGPELVGVEGRTVQNTYEEFQHTDESYRELVTSGRTNEAVDYRLESVAEAFDDYDQALLEMSEEKQEVFEQAIGRGEGALETLWRLLPYAIGVIGLLMIAGVWPRLKEYR
ncbi:hypothetical protein ITP53_25185 [Nonomuraea sp. K274]|uniref:Secreted protein n=1 Tax=Nonomuraea cypriaca TaxID=1187855 RepID=A0A931ABT9_9ACTN|nr:hypothetical protein [Nonomuraea cypriaca]MBF8188968.1 hypothetical protein [Nonomuraea cypriaca]